MDLLQDVYGDFESGSGERRMMSCVSVVTFRAVRKGLDPRVGEGVNPTISPSHPPPPTDSQNLCKAWVRPAFIPSSISNHSYRPTSMLRLSTKEHRKVHRGHNRSVSVSQNRLTFVVTWTSSISMNQPGSHWLIKYFSFLRRLWMKTVLTDKPIQFNRQLLR